MVITVEEIVIRLGVYGAEESIQQDLVKKFQQLLRSRVNARVGYIAPRRAKRSAESSRNDMRGDFEDSNVPEYSVILRDEYEAVFSDFQAEYNRLQARNSR